MSSEPIVISVIIPSYNHMNYVSDAINSVTEQIRTGFTIELIVIDDGSVDGSARLLQSLKDSGENQFTLILKQNEGLCATLNRAVRQHASGDYIAVLASDDIWHPEKLQKQIAHLSTNSGSELCYSNARTFGAELQSHRASKFLFKGNVRQILTLYNFVPAGTIVFTRKLYERIGGFDQTGLRLEDWDFLLRASAVTRFCYVDEELLFYRLHDQSAMAKMRSDCTLFGEKLKVLNKNKTLLNPILRSIAICAHFALDNVFRPVIYRLKRRAPFSDRT